MEGGGQERRGQLASAGEAPESGCDPAVEPTWRRSVGDRRRGRRSWERHAFSERDGVAVRGRGGRAGVARSRWRIARGRGAGRRARTVDSAGGRLALARVLYRGRRGE